MQKDNEKTLGSWGEGFCKFHPRAAFQRQRGAEELRKAAVQSEEGSAQLLGPAPCPLTPSCSSTSFGGAAPFGYLLLSLGPWDSTSSGFNPLQKFLRSRGPQPAPPLQYPLVGRGWGARESSWEHGSEAGVRSTGEPLSPLPAPKAHKGEGCRTAWGP